MMMREAARTAYEALREADDAAWGHAAVLHRHVITEALRLAALRPCEAQLVGIIQEIDEEIGFPTAKAIACAIMRAFQGRCEEADPLGRP